MTRIKRLGILTGGGDCPGLNAVIRMVAKKAMLEHKAKVFGILNGYEGLVHNQVRELGMNDVSGILPRGGTILGTTNRGTPYGAGGKGINPKAKRTLSKLDLDALIAVGGDGTMTISARYRQEGVPVVGVPKTIDNDVVGTDVTFGFDTAFGVVARSLDDLHTTAESHGRVLVVEAMGRDAGWIALAGGFAGGADVILIPEIPFDLARVAEYVRRRHKGYRHFTLVCVAEGASPKGMKQVEKRKGVLGGISVLVARDIEKRTGVGARAVILGHLQRSGSTSPADRILGSRFAAQAMDLAADGAFGHLAAVQGGKMVGVPIEEVAGRIRTVAPNHELVNMARAVGTSFGD